MIKNIFFLTLLTLFGTSGSAFAYVGPGAGLSLLGALWGLLLAIGAALAFVVLWPLRRFIKKMRTKREADAAEDNSATESQVHSESKTNTSLKQ